MPKGYSQTIVLRSVPATQAIRVVSCWLVNVNNYFTSHLYSRRSLLCWLLSHCCMRCCLAVRVVPESIVRLPQPLEYFSLSTVQALA